MVLFLFVITLLNPLRAESPDRLRNQGVVASILGFALLAELALVIRWGAAAALPLSLPPLSTEGNVQRLGKALYSTYLIPFEVTSVLLLVAIVGAVVLARGRSI
jgi:NADH-quinone oxidoreductase subunit J